MGYAELLHDDSSLSPGEARAATEIKEEVRRAQAAIFSFHKVAAAIEAQSDPKTVAE